MNSFCTGLIGADLIKRWLDTTIIKSALTLNFIYNCNTSKVVEQVADSRHYDLYILTAPDFAFVQDGTREGEHVRLEMHQWFTEVLNQKGKLYITVKGSHEQRMSHAIAAIAPLLVFPILDTP